MPAEQQEHAACLQRTAKPSSGPMMPSGTASFSPSSQKASCNPRGSSTLDRSE